jgi:hypothetical protein
VIPAPETRASNHVAWAALRHAHHRSFVSSMARSTAQAGYVEQVLMPALSPGDIVTMDNPGAQQVAGIRKALGPPGRRYSRGRLPVTSSPRSAAKGAPRDATGPQYPVAKVPRCLVSAAPINTPFSRIMLCAEPQASRTTTLWPSASIRRIVSGARPRSTCNSSGSHW